MRFGRRVVLVMAVGGLAAIGGYVALAAGGGAGPAPAAGPSSPPAAAQAAATSTTDVKAAGGCCREHGGTSGAHDASKCPMHAKEAAVAHASTGTAHKCPYLAGRSAVAAGTSPARAAATTAEGKKAAYTCPMHPEVKSAEKGRCPKCGMFLEPVR